ncbi:hypothetical protein [Xanthomonas sacchari]|uniref:hypothetical protein n=1 Tax=Xanthomonas sacchari TaxID=56458 RepID=UPI002257F1DF|nr:hypothetical protein [Xanthomonas sacchari]
MQMELTREQYDFLREWSASIPTLYFLDICVVGVTKFSDASISGNARKARCVAHLRSLDRPQNSFSYLCALMEKVSDSRGILSDDELESQVLGDLQALRMFFKNAKVYEPDDFVIDFFRVLRGAPIELQRPSYLCLLKAANDRFELRNPVSPTRRLAMTKDILNEADVLGVSRQHPLVTLILACIYGNSAARNLMKFKADPASFCAENALADIMAISRFAQLKLQIEFLGREGGEFLRSDFVTDDDGLTEVFRCFEPDVVRHEDKSNFRETRLKFTVKLRRLLAEIEQDEYDQVVDLLTQSAQSGL